jgi:HD superfamily phosphohydrolase YqeK
MDAHQLNTIQNRFTEYAQGFFGQDNFVNFNLHLKLCHSYKVQQESAYIAAELGLSDYDQKLANVIGLLHDTGRFPQFVKYRTYIDAKSQNHSEMGIEAISQYKLLDGVSESDRQLIITAIKYHSVKDVPAGLDTQCQLHTKIVRDADKLDIFRVVIAGYRLYTKDPAKYCYEVEYPSNGQYSAKILESVMRKETIDYQLIRSMDDVRLLQLAWVFDINFVPALQRITQKKYLEDMIKYMPNTPEINGAAKFVLDYVNQRINHNR